MLNNYLVYVYAREFVILGSTARSVQQISCWQFARWPGQWGERWQGQW